VVVVMVEDFKAIKAITIKATFVDAAVAVAVMDQDVVDTKMIGKCMIQINIAGIVRLLIMIYMFVENMQGNKGTKAISQIAGMAITKLCSTLLPLVR
jgi:hypothetical protein